MGQGRERRTSLHPRWGALPLVLGMVALLALLLMPTAQTTRFVGTLRDLTHVGIGAGVALVADRRLRRRTTSFAGLPTGLVATGATVLLFAAVELLQPLSGRSASWLDLYSTAAGATAAVLADGAWRRSGRARTLLALASAAALVLSAVHPVRVWMDLYRQHAAMPMLGSFEDARELSRWAVRGGALARHQGHATHGTHSLEVTLRPGPYPSVIMVWPVPDWRGYDALAFDLELAGDLALDVLLKVEDLEHGSGPQARSLTPLTLQPGLNRLRVPLACIAEAPRAAALDLGQVAGFSIMAVDLESARTLWLDRVRLERRP